MKDMVQSPMAPARGATTMIRIRRLAKAPHGSRSPIYRGTRACPCHGSPPYSPPSRIRQQSPAAARGGRKRVGTESPPGSLATTPRQGLPPLDPAWKTCTSGYIAIPVSNTYQILPHLAGAACTDITLHLHQSDSWEPSVEDGCRAWRRCQFSANRLKKIRCCGCSRMTSSFSFTPSPGPCGSVK